VDGGAVAERIGKGDESMKSISTSIMVIAGALWFYLGLANLERIVPVGPSADWLCDFAKLVDALAGRIFILFRKAPDG
jgi:hypothetical protein